MHPTTNAAHPIERSLTTRATTAEDLCDQFLDDVYAYVSRRVPSRSDTEDVVAETFQAAFHHAKRRSGTDPRLWLFGIARRKILDQQRRTRRRREVRLDPQAVAQGTPHSSLERSMAVEAVRAIVDKLPEEQREALLLQHLEGLTIAEIATVLGRSLAATNSLLQRARARVFKEGKSYFAEETQ